jgi:ribonuclease HII
MKKILLLTCLLGMMTMAEAQTTPAVAMADKIALKMKDSLNLTDHQKGQLFQINMQLHESKAAIYQQYTHGDSLRIHLQRIENSRDSLYRAVLNEEKYRLYRQRKQNLISNN